LLAALYALKTFDSSFGTAVNAVFARSKSFYDTLYNQLGVEYYSYLIAQGWAAFGYDESNIFNGIDSYSGSYVNVYGQVLPAVYTVAETLNHVLLESDTLVHQPSSNFINFANRVMLAQQGRGVALGKLSAWSVGGYAPDLFYIWEAFVDHDALQCGYCTPGMIMNAVAMLMKNPNPKRQDIINGMEDNLCRCGAHVRIIEAVETAAKEMKGGK
jgi:hypothetical protein